MVVVVITPEGRQQFLFYVCSIGVLVFAVSTIKEMLVLMCCCILRFLTAPRLVREYGNLRTQNRWFSKTKARKEIVLPRKIRDRMDTIIKVASAASVKRYPLRSVLAFSIFFITSTPSRRIFPIATLASSPILLHCFIDVGNLPSRSQLEQN